ncbi:hypothetical protein O181_000140 [Austropuccinia psidii MF-1]|uniref:Uncharacterized protein n=1 Tax=Austropuccinia psidii MF-1 TaxID=1389203 RepID=A0A9Q3B8B9_9BASI|nr:hypothetical protein [Austropuccinia psidii MF-1]
MNLSGLNIDVENVTSQTSSTWSIPNISITRIPPNPTNKQRLIPNRNFHVTSSLIQLRIWWNPRKPLGKVDGGQQKRPLENVTQSGLSKGNLGLMLHQSRAPKGKTVQSQEPIEDCDELYASSPLVHKEKVTGCHNPCASKPRIAHASSSREEIVDYEDENISPNHSETNDEPRRDNFMAHEGTQSNSELTHPQIPSNRVCLTNLRPERKKQGLQSSQCGKT